MNSLLIQHIFDKCINNTNNFTNKQFIRPHTSSAQQQFERCIFWLCISHFEVFCENGPHETEVIRWHCRLRPIWEGQDARSRAQPPCPRSTSICLSLLSSTILPTSPTNTLQFHRFLKNTYWKGKIFPFVTFHSSFVTAYAHNRVSGRDTGQ